MIDAIPFVQIIVCVASGVIASLLPSVRKPALFLLLGLLGIIAAYRRSVLGFILINGIVFAFALALERRPIKTDAGRKFRWRWSCALLTVLFVAFLIGRWMELEATGFSLAGVQWSLFSLDMWLVLRLATFLWEFGAGRINRPSLIHFTVWTSMPFTIIGPALRYSQFEPQLPWLRASEKKSDLYSKAWLLKLILGAALLICGAALVRLHSTMYADGGEGLPLWAKLADAFGVSPWSFLLLWSGYYKIMECLALMWGVALPPSFNMPFGRPNISEFWANWNMSATSIFRDYLFYTRWGKRKPSPYLNTMIIFLLVGLWHGSNWYWVIFGLMHGAGFCCFIWYRQKRSLKRFELAAVPFQLFGRVITYIFVCSCWIAPSRILKLLGRI